MFHMTISLLLCQFRASANSLSTTHCKSQKNSLAQLSQWPASVPPASPRTSRSGLRPQACTLHEEGKEGLARARKQQRYSALVFAQTQRISSMALKSNARDESTLYTLYSLLSTLSRDPDLSRHLAWSCSWCSCRAHCRHETSS